MRLCLSLCGQHFIYLSVLVVIFFPFFVDNQVVACRVVGYGKTVEIKDEGQPVQESRRVMKERGNQILRQSSMRLHICIKYSSMYGFAVHCTRLYRSPFLSAVLQYTV
jgi:hypothetical protein